MSELNPTFTVSELNSNIRHVLEGGFSQIWVTGEISNFHHHPASGHMYFTLKDSSCEMRCAMFRSHNQFLNFKPSEGMEVRVLGDVTLFESRGQIQLKLSRMEPAGVGDLFKAFEALKSSLESEGFFQEDIKQPIPPYPTTVGVVTSGSGAAYRDIVNVLTRRAPHVSIVLKSVQVQGDGASQQIASAIQQFNQDTQKVDVLIVGRGGGSLEDLWAFNEEVVARAIFESTIPIISAVGHETDFTIADFVADLRAPTPSAGAELAAPALEDLLNLLSQFQHKMATSIAHRFNQNWTLIDQIEKRLSLLQPQRKIQRQQEKVDQLYHRLSHSAHITISTFKQHLNFLQKQLINLSPTQVLDRGYAIPFDTGGQIIRQANQLNVGDSFTLKTAKGTMGAEKTSDIPEA